jgi:hypothetical protein
MWSRGVLAVGTGEASDPTIHALSLDWLVTLWGEIWAITDTTSLAPY